MDHARVGSLPDEALLEELPLPRVTINRLRVGGVMTLGELRAMDDRELLRLRHFGPHSLAEVRALVPAPAGLAAATPGSEVTIAGRTFLLGALYAPRRGGRGRPFKSRRLLEHSADSLLPGGRVRVATADGRRLLMGGEEWTAWAGEEVAS